MLRRVGHDSSAQAWLDDAEVAKRLGIRKRRVHDLRADYTGDFPAAQRDSEGRLLWPSGEIDAWATAQHVHPTGINARPGPSLAQEWVQATRGWTRHLPGPLAALGVLTIILQLYRERLTEHATNVDDYLYARQTDDILGSLASGGVGIVDAWQTYANNSPLVPTLAASIAAFNRAPNSLVLVQLPLVLGLLAAVSAMLRLTGVAGRPRWLVAGLIVVLPPVLTYTVMLNFSIAATLCTVGAVALYAASGRLRSAALSAGLGVALGLLVLSRVVALVYVAAILVAVAIDLLLDDADRTQRSANATRTAVIAVALAAPWWLTAGPQAMRYLLDAGYSSGSVFTVDASPIDTLVGRLTRTADETGWLLSGFLVLYFLLGVAGALRALLRARATKSGDEAARMAILSAAIVLLGLLFLGTSSNAGTAFALPFVVLMAVVGTAGSAMLVRGGTLPVRLAFWTVTSACLVLSVVAVFLPNRPSEVDGRQLWLSGTPARAQYEQALGCPCRLPDATELNERIYQRIGHRRMLVLRDDAIVNPESLRFLGQTRGGPVDLIAPAGGDTALDPALLETVDFALAGQTAAPYHAVDLAGAEATLEANGFRRVITDRLSPANVVVLWAAPGVSVPQ